MKKLTLMFAALMMAAMSFAATETTVYYTAPSSVVGTYTVKLNVHYGCNEGDPWEQFDMTLYADKTYNGDPIYVASFTDKWDGLCAMQFQLYDGTTWKDQQEVFNGSWHKPGSYNGLMYVHSTKEWEALPGNAPVAKKYYVAGTMNNWAVAKDSLTNGTYTATLDKGEYQFKITDGTWDKTWGYTEVDTLCSTAKVTGNSSNNIIFSIAQSQEVTIQFDAEAGKVCVKAITGEIESVYVVAGEEAITGYFWKGSATEAPENVMTLKEGVATLVKEKLTLKADTYKYKIVKNGATWIPDGDDLEIAIADSGLYNITYTYKEGENTATAVAERLDAPVVVPDTYYIVGELVPWGWDNEGTADEVPMQLKEENVYEFVVDSFVAEAKTYQYKLRANKTWTDSYQLPATGNAEYTFSAAGKYKLVFTANIASHTLSLEATNLAQDPTPVVDDVYTVVGSAVNGDNWVVDNTANDMTLVEGVYTLVVKEKTLEKGTREYKIVKNHSWAKENEVYPLKEDNSNATFDVAETAIYTITYTYNPATGAVNVNLEKTGEAAPITHVYSLVGTHFSWGWEPGNAPEMNKVNDSIYTYQIDTFAITAAPDTLYYKLTADHQWGVYELPSSGNNDYIFNEVGKYHLVFTANIASHTLGLEATKFADDTPVVTTKYYIAGTMNGWTANGTEIVDGTVTFKDLAAGTHEFKITNGAWASDGGAEYSTLDTECSSQGVTGGNGSNIKFTTYKVQDITISMDLTTFAICVKADTEKPEGAVDTYIIAGDENLLGVNWSGTAEQNKMTLVNDTATLVLDSVHLAAGNYEFKVVKNGGEWIPDGMGNNSSVSINTEGYYRVTFTYIEGSQAATAVAELLGEPVVVPDVFTVAGSSTALFGTAWDATNTDNDMTEMTVEGTTGYVLVKANIELKENDTIEWKVVKNHSWDVNYGDPQNGNNNYQNIITKDGLYNVAFVFIEIAGYGHMAEATFEPVDSTATVYYLAGNKELTGYNWAPDSLAMIEGAIILKDVPAGTHAFKITDGRWNSDTETGHEFTELDSACVSANVTHSANGNITFTTDKVQNITIAIQENKKICVLVEAIEVKEVYTVAGNAVNGDNWDITNTENEMQLVDGIYTLVVTGVTLENGHKIEYKIIKGHSWTDEEIFPNAGGSNAVYEITEETAIYTITYTYNPLSGAVSIQLEKTGEAAPITHVYSLVGEFFTWGWEPANAPEMTKLNDSIYTYQIDTFAITAAPDTLYFKLTADHQWGVYELPAQGDYYYAFSQVGSYQLNFTANIASHYVVLDATLLKTDTTIVDTKYYIAGNMNGWTVNGTEIVNGTVTFTDLPAGKHEFKVTDGQWGDGHEFTTLDTECTSQGVTGGNGQNIVFTTSTVQDVTITFDGSLICVKVVTGEAPKVYYLAGDEGLMGTGHGWWKDYAERALDANGSITIKDVPVGAHAFKITDGNWNSDTETGHEFTALDTECSSKGVTGGNGSNIEFTTYKVQDVTIAMDLTSFAICVTADCEKPAEFEDIYVIAGDEKLLGVNWSGTAEQNKMTVADGTATLVLDSVRLSAGNYEFKVVKNGGQWIPDGTGNNSVLSINEEGYYKVTFTYVLGSQAATAEAELIGEPVVVTHYYYIMGEFSPWGWDDAGTAEKEAMTLKADGTYEYVIANFKAEAKTYQYKLREGNTWENSYQIPVSGNAEYTFTEAGDYKLVFTADTKNNTLNLEATKAGETPQDVDYYLFGYINGANYGCEDDYQNMGDYKFVNGALTATFTEKSYVAVKTTGNAAWFMTNGYPGDDATSAVLYNTQNLGETADKLPVPASVEVNFTLVVNDDGTLTLSYVAGTGSGLDNIESVLDTAAPMYNVLGQKVNVQYKGIIIQNGKKYLVR